jgi:hypothetical protein
MMEESIIDEELFLFLEEDTEEEKDKEKKKEDEGTVNLNSHRPASDDNWDPPGMSFVLENLIVLPKKLSKDLSAFLHLELFLFLSHLANILKYG